MVKFRLVSNYKTIKNMGNNKKNWFVRILIILLCLGIVSMIYFSFFCVAPYGEFKNGMFFLLSILLILVLSESFDNFSVGKIISIEREIKNKENENQRLERKNTELISHIISITNTQTQKQQSTNIFGDYYSDNPKELQPIVNDNVQELIDRIGSSPAIIEIETDIKKELAEKGLEITEEATKVLLRHLAGTQLILIFERIHSAIFGSQISLLRRISSHLDGMPEDEVSQYFIKVKHQFPDLNNWSIEDYLLYLFNNGLLSKLNNNIFITNLGIEYLTWITRNRITEDKSL